MEIQETLKLVKNKHIVRKWLLQLLAQLEDSEVVEADKHEIGHTTSIEITFG